MIDWRFILFLSSRIIQSVVLFIVCFLIGVYGNEADFLLFILIVLVWIRLSR